MLPNGKDRPATRAHQAALVAMLAFFTLVNLIPTLRASALYLLTDGEQTVVVGERAPTSDRIIVVGAASDPEVQLTGGQEVEIVDGEEVRHATTRSGETVKRLLSRLDVTVGPWEMVKIDVSGDPIRVTVGSDFTYYETAVEAVAHLTIYTPDPTLPKGQLITDVEGADGVREVVYEVVYADGELVSRQAVEERRNTSITAQVRRGTLVERAQDGDIVVKDAPSGDGSGYLIMASGDSLHYVSSMRVRCTAYTTGDPGVGTITYTGTTVHRGVVAVDKKVIPLGSTMFLAMDEAEWTYGMAHAEDTGVRGTTVDVYLESDYACRQFGVRQATAYFLDVEE